jgi:hypothetical protein
VSIFLLKYTSNFNVSAPTILVHTSEKYKKKNRKDFLKWMKKNKYKKKIVETRRKNERERMEIKNKLFPEKMKKTRKIKRDYINK